MDSKLVPKQMIFGVADPDHVGPMPVRQDIEVLPADPPRQTKLGWTVYEISYATGLSMYCKSYSTFCASYLRKQRRKKND